MIRAASPQAMRAVLHEITTHLCRDLRPVPDDIVTTGDISLHAGFGLYQHAAGTAAAIFLHALGLDPARAADQAYHASHIDPILRHAPARRLRRMLTDLTRCVHATVADSGHAAQLSATTTVPDEIWHVAAGIATAIALYDHAVRTSAVQILYYIWDGLSTSNPLAALPLTRDFPTDTTTIHPN